MIGGISRLAVLGPGGGQRGEKGPWGGGMGALSTHFHCDGGPKRGRERGAEHEGSYDALSPSATNLYAC